MHEYGIAEEMLKVALDYAAKNHAARITAFNVEISAAADESEDALRFHLDTLVRGTPADGARIDIVRIPAVAKCLDCGNEFAWGSLEAACPRCSGTRLHPLPQDEFRLVSIDVE
ncbi:MAG: hydrogenase maturation nickel metallochaperone HypA [Chloroflexota bacterium]|nr:hydrogenase maturation nickel metallochaperone HypA [Chloroflexota bacterium]